ncbi:MAG: carboxypeptidase regulatory-like domain-containing protein [bacterium]|nr:MAG: carboxypeptidase regulatory-like domain-containing protein [bacterium]
MKRLNPWIVLVAIACVTFSGCSRQDNPIAPGHPNNDLLSAVHTPLESSTTTPVFVPTSIVLNGYLVQFDGREYVNDQTTFSYTVSGAGAMHILSNFFLEIPDCAPEPDSYSPPGAVINVNPLIGIYGIKWDQHLGVNESRPYSITFPGDVPLGIIRTSVKASTLAAIGDIAGPCAGFDISGTVYIDADANGVMDQTGESGIANVTVTIENSTGLIHNTTTDADGGYAFLVTAGTYTVRIETSTAAEDFNEELAESFDPTGPISLTVTVGPDSPGNDFGFDPKAQKIEYEIDQGILLTTGEPAKFWRKQLRAAISGSQGKVEFDAATLAQFITEIQGLYFPEPFQFTSGNEFQEAMEILSIKSKDPVQQLLRELLAAEFNEVSGKGLVDAPELQSALLAWAESVYIDATPGTEQIPANTNAPLLGLNGDDRLGDAIGVLLRMNGNIGGGSGGGG